MFFSRFYQFLKRFFFPEGQDVFWKRAAQLSLGVFFVTLFIPLKLSVYGPSLFFGGDFNPYQHFYLYLSDLFLIAAFLLFGIHFFMHSNEVLNLHFGNRYLLIFWLSLLVLSEVSVLFSADRMLGTLLLIRFVECFLLYFLIINHLFPLQALFLIFVFGLFGESLLGLYQYIRGTSLGLFFLGEPVLGTGMTGVSTLIVGGEKVLRAYGTFLHPQIFAAYLLFGLFAIKNIYRRNPYSYAIIALILVVGFLITFSRVAFVAGIVGLFVYHLLTKRRLSNRTMGIFGVVLLFFVVSLNIHGVFFERARFQDTQALQFRAENFTDGVRLLLQHPLGVGLGSSSQTLQSIAPGKLSPWEYQPPHNLFLIAGIELGWLGFVLYVALFVFLLTALYRVRSQSPQVFVLWVMVTIISFTDHYFFSLYPGIVLFTILFSLSGVTIYEASDGGDERIGNS